MSFRSQNGIVIRLLPRWPRGSTSGCSRRRRTTRARQPIFDLHSLEQRLFLSLSPIIRGEPVAIDNGSQVSYQLTLGATGSQTSSITKWEIDWGHGSIQTHTGTPPTSPVQHDFPLGVSTSYPVKARPFIGATPYNWVALAPDREFDNVGQDGIITHDSPGGTDIGYGMAVQADGKVVVAGVYQGVNFLVARFNADGSLDTTFGAGGTDGDGVVSTDFGGTTDAAHAVAIQPDGKIVAAGKAGINFAAARYLPDGQLDPTFGQFVTGSTTDRTGKVTTGFASGSCSGNDTASAYSLVLLPDGKVVLAGTAPVVDGSNRWQFAAARYTAHGDLDRGFGTDGKKTIEMPSNAAGAVSSYAHALALQADGRLVLGGYGYASSAGSGLSEYQFALARLNADGSLDDNTGGDSTPGDKFGPDGRVVTDFAPNSSLNESAYSLVIQPNDQKIVAAGEYNGDFALARYNPDGTLDGGSTTNDSNPNDTNFGTAGKVTTNINGGSDTAYGVAVRPDGDGTSYLITAAGRAAASALNGTSNEFAVARYKPDGTLDSDFGIGGTLSTDIASAGSATSDIGRSVVILSDGRTLVGGYSGSKLALVQYNPYNRVNVVLPDQPRVEFTLPSSVIDQDTPLFGYIDDPDDNLIDWTLKAQPVTQISGDSDADILIAQGTREVGFTAPSDLSLPGFTNVIATLKPTLLPQGEYNLILTGNVPEGAYSYSQYVEVKTELKLGNFSLPAVDLMIPAPGLPITVSRFYDTTRAGEDSGDFGPGWRWELPDVNLQTTARVEGDTFAFDTSAFPAFRLGDTVSLTLPGGERHVFSFEPEDLSPENPFDNVWGPNFEPVNGVTSRLEVDLTDLSYTDGWFLEKTGTNDFYGVFTWRSNLGYNPKHGDFGGWYELVTKEGTRYHVNGNSGKVEWITDRNGNELDFVTDPTKITQSHPNVAGSAISVTIERGGPNVPAGKNYISAIVDPEGKRVEYRYDLTTGDLKTVVERARINGQEVTTEYTYNAAHLLTGVIDPRGVKVLEATYMGAALTSLKDVHKKAALVNNQSFDAGSMTQSTADPFGNVTETAYNDRGHVTREMRRFHNAAGQVRYSVIAYAYDYWSGAAGNNVRFRYTSVPFEATEAAKLTAQPTVWASIVEYNGNANSTGGNLLSERTGATVADPNNTGRLTLYEDYDPFGQPGRITDPAGNIRVFEYDPANGNLLRTYALLSDGVTHRDELKYAYNDRGELRTVHKVFSPTDERLVTEHTYNGTYGRRDSTTDATTGLTRTFTYDVNGNLEQVRYRWDNGTPADLTDDRFVDDLTTHDESDRVTGTTDGRQRNPDETPVAGRSGVTNATYYNKLGNVERTTDEYGRDTLYDYDARGNLIQVRYPDGTLTRTVYDVMGRPIWTVDRYKPTSPDAGAYGTQTIYDELGDVKEAQRYSAVLIVVELDPDPNLPAGHSIQRSRFVSQGTLLSTTVTTYDAARRVGSVRGPDGRTTNYTYDDQGRTKTVRNPLNQPTTYDYYDVDPADGVTLRRHDVVTDAAGRKVTTDYDYAGRVVKTTWHGDNSTTADDVYTDATYSDHGLFVTETDQERQPTDSEYDLAGQLTAVLQADPDGPGGVQVRPRWVYGYDKYSNQKLLRDPRDNDTFGGTENRETVFGYDAIGLRTRRTLPEGQFETWTYDQYGRVDLRTDFKDQKAKHVYYASGVHAGRLQEVRYYGGAQEPALPEKVEYQYDDLGRTKQVTERAANTGAITRTTTYTYDSDDRLTDQLVYGPGKVPGVDAADAQLHYEYHAATGRLTRTYTGTSVAPVTDVRYGYDELGRLKSVTVEKLNGAVPPAMPASTRYDAVGNSLGSTALPNTVYTYDAVGNLNTVTASNGVVLDYDYDPFHRLDVLTVKKTSAGPNLVKYDYQVLADGQRDYMDETSYDALGNPTGTVRTDWGYDNLNRLTTEQYASVGQTGYYRVDYTYNEVGNRLSKVVDKNGTSSDETINYTWYDRNDRLRTESSSLSGQTSYDYDANGSMTSRQNGTQNDSYNYDLRNRLTSATVAAITTTFGYDHAGNRISRTTPSGTTYFVVDANNPTGYGQVLQESATLGGSPGVTFIYGLDLVSQNRAGTDSYYAYDGIGSTRLLTNSSGAVTDTYRYDAFGVAQSSSGPTINDYRFAGERLESSTGNVHLRTRDYTPGTGRFTTLDAFEGDLTDPASLHRYLYANGNPIYFADPGGTFSITNLITTIGIYALKVYKRADLALRAYGVVSDVRDARETFDKVVNSEELDWGDYAMMASVGAEYLNPFKFISFSRGVLNTGYRLFKRATPILHRITDRVVKKHLRAQARSVLKTAGVKIPKDWEVHHRIPLEWAHKFPNAEPNRLANLAAYEPDVHHRITQLWNQFKDRYPAGVEPSQADIMKMVIRVERFTQRFAVRAA